MKTGGQRKEEIAEDYCFVCKDGGTLLICEYRDCLKAYHPQCVGKDESCLGTEECWTCSWHSCFICHKSSNLKCFCCPSSVCGKCIRSAEFVQLRKTKGFCTNCLKLALLIAENADVDSDGCKVDFKDRETYEFLFKDYWEIVKEQENLSLKDLHEADALLKKGENCIYGSELDQIFEDEGQSPTDVDEMNINFENTPFLENKGFKHTKKGNLKRCRSQKRSFAGWGSVELIQFLTSVGEDTKEPLQQWDIHKIIEKHIKENNLLQPNKKKKTVLCDKMLHSLFRKRTIKLNKIYNLLEDHFASNVDLDDESPSGSEEDIDLMVGQRFQQKCSGTVQRNKTEYDSEQPKSCYASMIAQNIKLVYLRRSLVKEFLGTPETLEGKVVGCFVRVKCDPKDFHYLHSKVYQLGLVTAIEKVRKAYMVGEASTDVILRVANIWREVYISMLSDDDFEEEECEDLRQLVKKGLFKRPTVAEFEEKVRSIHEEIMNHWIKREIVILQRQIDKASEKGWNREKCEYIERRAILQTHAEQQRLVKEIPKVIPDVEEFVNRNSQLNFHGEGNKTATGEMTVKAKAEGKKSAPCDCKAVEKVAEGHKSAPCDCEAVEKEAEGNIGASIDVVVEMENEGNSTAIHEKVRKYEELDQDKSTDTKKSRDDIIIIEIDEDDEPKKADDHSKLVIDDDEAEAEGIVMAKRSETSNTLEETPGTVGEHKQVWYYVDPSGKEQGPFAMVSLRYWRSMGFFDNDFRVWRAGQSQADAMLLTEAILLTNPEN